LTCKFTHTELSTTMPNRQLCECQPSCRRILSHRTQMCHYQFQDALGIVNHSRDYVRTVFVDLEVNDGWVRTCGLQ
jgi:hypothetical protein